MTVPSIRYARSDDLHIAYQEVGDGPLDLVFVPGAWSHLEVFWEEPSVARFFRRLSGFSRLILFDKRGTGLSDRVDVLPTLEQRMDDVRAVMDAVGSVRAALLGVSEGGPMCALFAATYPRRTTKLVLLGSTARLVKTDDYPWGRPAELTDVFLEQIERGWGQAISLPLFAPSAVGDERLERWFGRLERLGASPGAAVALIRMAAETDVRHLLPSISVPTLILHRTGDRVVPVEAARYLAERIPESRYMDTAGDGFFATFDGPARAVRCALTIRDAVRQLGIDIRAGVHAGECEKIGGKTGGLAVHIGARVAGVARAGEVIVSSTVKDLVAGSGLRFVDRGTHELKGIPDSWRLFAAEEPAA